MTVPVILWFRRDLRLSDQAALRAACADGPVLPVYVLDDETPRHRRMGAASRWWLHHGLASLSHGLVERGSRLILRRGRSEDVLARLAGETGARRVHCLRHYEPWWRNAERAVAGRLDLVRHDGNYLLPPGTLTNGSGEPYRIYTPFMRALRLRLNPPRPIPQPSTIPAPDRWPESDSLDDWDLTPSGPDWAAGLRERWTPGEPAAQRRLSAFLDRAGEYGELRDLPGEEGTSSLSPHLHFGEISPARVWDAVAGAGKGAEPFLRELIWRDYAQNIILALPDYGKANGRPGFDDFPWRIGAKAEADLAAWRRGRTGYPIVDAGMRQLWATGWMHNRVRMIAASFLVKHLLVDWRVGEQWFWDTLVDADYAQNSVNWQWVAGSGVDANQFSRIMAPLVQSRRFDAGGYIRRWVPELSHLGDEAVHDPDSAGCRPPDYPAPIVGHREGRERALAAWRSSKA